MKKLLVLAAIFALLFAGCDETQEEITTEQPTLTVEWGGENVTKNGTVELGEVTTGTVRQYSFTIKNTGAGNLRFDEDTPINIDSNTDVFEVVQPTRTEIEPDDSITFRIDFNPQNSQPYTAIVTILSNSQEGDFVFTINASGTEAPKPIAAVFVGDKEYRPNDTIDAGNIFITQSGSITIIIRNFGDELLTIDTASISITGANADAFDKTTDPGSSVSAGGGMTSFNITVTPTAEGVNHATLTIPNNDTSNNPYTVILQATGVKGSAVLLLQSQDGEDIPHNSLAPIDYGRVLVGGNEPRSFTIKNNGGNINLNLTGDPIISSSNPVFSVSTQPITQTIAPDASTLFVISYQPTTESIHTSTITIANNSNIPLFTFTVTGTGYTLKPVAVILYDGEEIPQNGTIDAGEVLITQSKTFAVTIRNTGDAVLSIDSANITITGADAAAFQRISSPNASIQEGNQSSFNIQFMPEKQGENNATLTIPTNDSSRNPVTVFLRGIALQGSPILELKYQDFIIPSGSVTPFEFGTVVVGQNMVFTFTIENKGNIPLVLGTPAVASSNPVFAVTNQPANSTINPGVSVQFVLRYQPDTEGPDAGQITIASNSSQTPFTLNLVGTGYVFKPAAVISYEADVIPQNGTIDVGEAIITHSKTITVTISNAGDAVLTVDTANITITGADAHTFQRTSNPNASIQAGSSSTFTIECTPVSVGEKNAILTIPTNDGSRNPVVVNLRITGLPEV